MVWISTIIQVSGILTISKLHSSSLVSNPSRVLHISFLNIDLLIYSSEYEYFTALYSIKTIINKQLYPT